MHLLESLLDLPEIANEVEAEMCRRSLAYFVRKAWPIVEPGTPLVWNWHIDTICQHLEAVTHGDICKLLINVPPGHMKSLLVSVFWPAWEWTIDPCIRSQFGSYDDSLVLRDSVKTRDLLDSEWYKSTFRPDWRMKRDANAKGYFVNTAQGLRRTFTVGGKATGHRGDHLAIDDPLNARDRYNKGVKDYIIEQYDKVLSTRVNDPRKAKFVVIMQRLAADDLSGHLIGRNGDILKQLADEGWHGDFVKEIARRGGYDVVCLPSEFDPDRRSTTSIGWTDPRTERGELLFPAYFTAEVLAGLKLSLGSDDYAGQHQQSPSDADGGAFKSTWFRHWILVDESQRVILLDLGGGVTRPYRLSECRTLATVDVAVGIKKRNDYTVYAIWAVTPDHNLVLLDRHKLRVEEPDSIALAVRLYEQWRGVGHGFYFGVEANGVGRPLAQNMRAKGLPVVEIDVHDDKMVMSTTARVRCEAGQIYFPLKAAWLPEWEGQLTVFPNGQHDDEVTAISLAAEQVFQSSGTAKPPERVEMERRTVHDQRGPSDGVGVSLVGRATGRDGPGRESREEWHRRR